MENINIDKLRILVLGGRGFLGEAVCHELREHELFTFGRSPGETNHFQGDIRSLDNLKNAMTDKDCVINLIALTPLRNPRGVSYEEIHVQGVENILLACEEIVIRKLIHVSGLGADKNSKIEYKRTKAEAERLILQSGVPSTVFCPSLIFDRGNELVEQARKLAYGLTFPYIPARIQPIFRGDMAKLIGLAVEGAITETRIEVAGPEIMTIFEFARKIFHSKGLPCFPIPLFLLKPGMRLAAFLNLFGLSKDQISSLYSDSITYSNGAENYIQLTSVDGWLGNASKG
ncbi:NAD-dependent epimerase/dehydratase family protein [Candidatus Poribacteria bacterium]